MKINNVIQFLWVIVIATGYSYADWVHQLGGQGRDEPSATIIDASGRIYIGGVFSDSAIFQDTILRSKGEFDAFIAVYNADGTSRWIRTFGGNSGDYIHGISVDSIGNIYAHGNYLSDTLFLGDTVLTHSIAAGFDEYLLKLDSSGEPLWVKWSDGFTNSYGHCQVVDKNGNLYIAGNLGPTGVFNENLPTGSSPLFSKYDSEGTLLWAKGGSTGSQPLFWHIFLSRPSLMYCVGETQSFSGQYSTLTERAHITKADTSGHIYWDKTLLMASINHSMLGGASRFENAVPDMHGGIFACGWFTDSIFCDSNIVLISNGYEDAMIIRYDSSGNIIWAGSGGGTNNDGATTLCTDSLGSIYVAGFFDSIAEFGQFTLKAIKSSACFLAKYDSSGTLKYAIVLETGDENDMPQMISIFPDDKLFYAGFFGGNTKLNSFPLQSYGMSDIVIGLFQIPSPSQTLIPTSAYSHFNSVTIADYRLFALNGRCLSFSNLYRATPNKCFPNKWASANSSLNFLKTKHNNLAVSK